MKKVSLLLMIVATVAITTFFSCQKETKRYSCDDKINEFVTMNLDNFTDISWATLITYSDDTARAIYVSLSPENKMNIWIEKFEFMIENDESLNENELSFLQDVKNGLIIDFFEDDADADEFALFTNTVYNNAVDLGWSENRIGISFGSVFTTINPGLITEGNCNCVHDSINSCWNVCGYIKDCPNADKGGCGWFWQEDCNGICQP